jgi:hypothetical protein
MKKIVFIITFFFFLSAFANAQDADILRELQDSVNQLDLQVANLLKIIEMQRREIDHLKKLCQQAGVDTNAAPTGISNLIFGIHLGEELETLSARQKVSKSDYTFADKNFRGQVWSVECNDPNVKNILVYVFNRRIYEIDIEFADANAANCKAIEERLKKNYHHIYRNTFETMIDGVNVGIELNCITGLGTDSKIILSYIHVPILTEIYAEIGKTRANKLSQ